MRMVFLYTEIAKYVLACLNTLATKYNAEVHIVNWPVNKEAPYEFSFNNSISVYYKNKFSRKSLNDLVSDISPNLIYCSGWIDKDYLSVCRKFNAKIPVILGSDNKWIGGFRQHVASLLGKHFINTHFSHCWVPGSVHKQYSEKIGFDSNKILTGLYSADFNFFHNQYLSNYENKKKKFPKRFIFAGRYYEFKGIKELWNAFMEIQVENPNEWELWCLGTGDIKPVLHPKIKHFGFVQPIEMGKFIADCGVFILPSRFEPWGVAVHEFASAGFPLICSDEVGAAELFLKNEENGFLFKSGDSTALKNVMKKIILMNDEQLFTMSAMSAELAKQITPDIWADTLMSIIKDSNRNYLH